MLCPKKYIQAYYVGIDSVHMLSVGYDYLCFIKHTYFLCRNLVFSMNLRISNACLLNGKNRRHRIRGQFMFLPDKKFQKT